jgi:hypothetical protein
VHPAVGSASGVLQAPAQPKLGREVHVVVISSFNLCTVRAGFQVLVVAKTNLGKMFRKTHISTIKTSAVIPVL